MTIVDNRTPNRSYTEPYGLNDLADDVARLVAAIRGIDTDMAAVLTSLGDKANTGHHHSISEIDGLQSVLDDKAAYDHDHALNDLSDVDVSATTDGMFLKRVAGQWVASNITLGDFGYLVKEENLADLEDIKEARQNIGLYRSLLVANANTNLSGANSSVTDVLYTAAWSVQRTVTLPLANSRNRGDVIQFRDPSNIIFPWSPAWQAQGTDSMQGTPLFMGKERIAVLESDGVSKWIARNKPAHGSGCVLRMSSSTSLVLEPITGCNLNIRGVEEFVPDSGIGVTIGSLSANFIYYIYAALSTTGVWSLEVSLNSPISGLFGTQVHPSHQDWTLVGKVRTDAAGQLVDSEQQRFVRTFFNDPGVQILSGNSSGASSGSTSFVEIDPALKVEVLMWPNEILSLAAHGFCSNTVAGERVHTGITVSGLNPSSPFTCVASQVANQPMPFSPSYAGRRSNYQYATLLGRVTGGTGRWNLPGESAGIAICGHTSGSGF